MSLELSYLYARLTCRKGAFGMRGRGVGFEKSGQQQAGG